MSQHHDPVHPDSGHLTPELIADLDEGLLDAESAAHVQHHLDTCEQCRDIHRQLREVTAALADLPAVAMPDDVEAQLLAGLPTSLNRTIVPIDQARSRRSGGTMGKVLGATAGVAAVLLIGAIVYAPFSKNDSPGSPDNAQLGTSPENSVNTTQGDIQLASYTATTSGTTYSADTLPRQVDTLVQTPTTVASVATVSPTPGQYSTTPTPSAKATASASWDDPAMERAAGMPLVTDPAVAERCVVNTLQGHNPPLAIDLGRYKNRPAVIIVLPSDSDPTHRAEVWVISPSCGGLNPVQAYFQITLP